MVNALPSFLIVPLLLSLLLASLLALPPSLTAPHILSLPHLCMQYVRRPPHHHSCTELPIVRQALTPRTRRTLRRPPFSLRPPICRSTRRAGCAAPPLWPAISTPALRTAVTPPGHDAAALALSTRCTALHRPPTLQTRLRRSPTLCQALGAGVGYERRPVWGARDARQYRAAKVHTCVPGGAHRLQTAAHNGWSVGRRCAVHKHAMWDCANWMRGHVHHARYRGETSAREGGWRCQQKGSG